MSFTFKVLGTRTRTTLIKLMASWVMQIAVTSTDCIVRAAYDCASPELININQTCCAHGRQPVGKQEDIETFPQAAKASAIASPIFSLDCKHTHTSVSISIQFELALCSQAHAHVPWTETAIVGQVRRANCAAAAEAYTRNKLCLDPTTPSAI